MGSSLSLKTASGYQSPGADLGSDGTALRQPGKRPSMERLPNKGGSMSRKSRAAGSSPGVPTSREGTPTTFFKTPCRNMGCFVII